MGSKDRNQDKEEGSAMRAHDKYKEVRQGGSTEQDKHRGVLGQDHNKEAGSATQYKQLVVSKPLCPRNSNCNVPNSSERNNNPSPQQSGE